MLHKKISQIIIILLFLSTRFVFASAEITFRDLDGNFIDLPQPEQKAAVLFFADINCPVANAYIPRINELNLEYGTRNVQFLVVYVQGNKPWSVARHKNEFKIDPPVVIDYDGQIQRRLAPKVMGQVIVLAPDFSVTYSGRVDDQFAVGLRKPTAGTHELRNVLKSIVSEKSQIFQSVEASGCAYGPARVDTAVPKVTYLKDIAPLIRTHCASCHQEQGTAPFSLSNYTEVSRIAPALAVVLREYKMPPWFSDTSPDNLSHATALPDEDRRTLLNWIAQGVPRGVGMEQRATKGKAGWRLGRPDVVIKVPSGQVIPPSGKNIFREFAIDLKTGKDIWVQKVDFQTDFPKAVHHIVIYTRKKGWEKLTEQSADRWGYFAGFVPGSGPTVFPAGIAKRIPSDHELVINIHYVPIGREIIDQSKVAIYFSKTKAPTELFTDSVRELDINIPPGDRRFKIVAERKIKEDILIRSFIPHAHYRGKSFLVTAQDPEGNVQELLSVPYYTFTWQSTYTFKKPINLAKGSSLRCEALYDNSVRNPQNPDPTAKVGFGPQSEDEMMFCFYDYQLAGQK
jgi:hypothetical protein